MPETYHPLSVMGGVNTSHGSFSQRWCAPRAAEGEDNPILGPADPRFGTTLHLENTRPKSVFIAGIRVLNAPWELVLIQLGPIFSPVDAAAFNLDAVPGPPGWCYPFPENPRFVKYPMGELRAGETLPIRVCSYGSPSAWPTLNMIFFVVDVDDVDG